MDKNYLKLRIFLFSLLILAVLFLIYKAVVPFGKITYTTNICDKSLFITQLKPKGRMDGKCQNIIIGDPVYFNLNTQRTFDSAKVMLKYKSSEKNSIIELGLLADQQKNYILKPVANKIINDLNWDKIEANNVALLQREKKFNSIEEFLNNLPDKNEIAVYKYDLPLVAEIQNYQSNGKITTIDKSLRGSYQIYTYIDNEELDWQFNFFDINEGEKADPITVNLYRDNQLIATENLADDGIIEATRVKTDVRNLNLRLSSLPAGIYKIAIVVGNDIITKQITTKQNIVSFINKIWLYENNNTELLTLYTDSSEINARTNSPAGLQKILINNEVLNINETYRQFTRASNFPISEIRFAKDGMVLIGDGVFSFSQKALYNPSYKKITKSTNIDDLNINYIITTYQPAEIIDGWKTQTIKFDLQGKWREDNNYGFIITVPGLSAEDDIDDYVEVGEIKVELEGRTLLEKFLNF